MSDNEDYYIHLGIAVRIPMAFEKFCEKSYTLEEQVPEGLEKISDDSRVKTIFHIYNEEKEKVATFNPNGEFLCIKDSFKSIFDRIVEDLDYAAYKAKQAQDDIDKKLAERFDEEINLNE
jgi:hypothetical protein